MRIFLTGGSGFIGKAFIPAAVNAGHYVQKLNGLWTQENSLSSIPWKTFDALVHLAAAGVQRPDRDWQNCMEGNFHFTRRILTALQESGALIKVWYPRSVREIEVGGRTALWGDPYVVTKKMASLFVKDWAEHYGAPVFTQMLGPCYDAGIVDRVAADILKDISS